MVKMNTGRWRWSESHHTRRGMQCKMPVVECRGVEGCEDRLVEAYANG